MLKVNNSTHIIYNPLCILSTQVYGFLKIYIYNYIYIYTYLRSSIRHCSPFSHLLITSYGIPLLVYPECYLASSVLRYYISFG